MPLLLSLLLTVWPADEARVVVLPLPSRPVKKVRVFVDAGHGAPGNVGNSGCLCQLEQDHTLEVAQHLAFVLAATGRFEVKLSRAPGEVSRYQARIAAAEAFRAEVIISLHSDARGFASEFPQGDGGMCWRNPDAPGFSVLWNEEGPAVTGRERLGRAVGARPSKIPTVIIETHHALDVREVARWTELATVDAFAFAVGAAVLDVLTK